MLHVELVVDTVVVEDDSSCDGLVHLVSSSSSHEEIHTVLHVELVVDTVVVEDGSCCSKEGN